MVTIFLNKFKKTELNSHSIQKYKYLSIWTPGGSDGCQTGLDLADYYARNIGKVAVIELPCLNIPRLAFYFDSTFDKQKNTNSLLLDYEREPDHVVPAKYLTQISEQLYVLPANAHSTPDVPVTRKLKYLDTLINFPTYLLQHLTKENFELVIFILQGGLTEPMTFMSLQKSEHIIINVNTPVETGWALANYKRLKEVYKYGPERFSLYGPELDSKIVINMSDINVLSSTTDLLKGGE